MQPSKRHLTPVYQKPSDLELAIADQQIPVHFTIYKSRLIRAKKIRAIFRIIGESHWITLEHEDGAVFHEALACIRMPTCNLMHHHCFSLQQPHRFSNDYYAIRVEFHHALPGKHQTAFDEAPPLLKMEFPPIYGQIPVTQINLSQVDGYLYWSTLHLYPRQHGLIAVETRSEYRLKE